MLNPFYDAVVEEEGTYNYEEVTQILPSILTLKQDKINSEEDTEVKTGYQPLSIEHENKMKMAKSNDVPKKQKLSAWVLKNILPTILVDAIQQNFPMIDESAIIDGSSDINVHTKLQYTKCWEWFGTS